MSNDRTRADLREANARLIRDNGELRETIATLRAALVEAEVFLAQREWQRWDLSGDLGCIECRQYQHIGHRAGCAHASALTAVRRALGGG